ncbi:MAG: methylated-DNA--[protein]-cysteine S-methyltransferase [Frankiales bacterium]|nr:methylated-DNA--[protein]-cysteine S-methyltransferase [Frankiales bacterium]
MTSPVLATTLATPVGDMSLLVQDDALIGAGFTPVADQFSRLATSDELREVADLGPFSAAMRDYFAGNVSAFDDLPVEQPGGAFRQAAWKVMREVPAGEVISYAELAARAGNPNAVRAAGSACAQNRVAPIVPCHRIVRTGGNLGGYYYGLTVKSWLLRHERGEQDPVQGELIPVETALVRGG